MVRLTFIIIFIVAGFWLPSWLFLVSLGIAGFFFPNFWEAIVIMTILNLVYVYSGASFQAEYIVWGVGVFLLSWFVHTRTRFKKVDTI